MSDRIIYTLKTLREYARGLAASRDVEVEISYHEENSHLMRFANSAVSLNTNEHLVRLNFTAVEGRRRASRSMITNLSEVAEMKQGLASAVEMTAHAQPLLYEPTVTVLDQPHVNETYWNDELATMPNGHKLEYFNQMVEGLETDDLKLSGIFSSGTSIQAVINTRSDHAIYFKTSDAQVSVVLAHETLKWEIIAEQSAQRRNDLDPAPLRRELAFLKKHYENDAPRQLALGNYDIVFGPAAIATMLTFMNGIGFNGGLMKRGYSFLTEEQIGRMVFSSKINLIDDPRRRETFPLDRDMTGLTRNPRPLIDQGRFSGFTWSQDDADEFHQQPTGHSVPRKSLCLAGGDNPISGLEELVNTPRDRDTVYIPFLHYTNIVNPSKGIITSSSRFGALLLKKDGGVELPFNVRLTQPLSDLFGGKVAWLTRDTLACNTSSSYGPRNPTAVIVPRYMKVEDLEISHANASY